MNVASELVKRSQVACVRCESDGHQLTAAVAATAPTRCQLGSLQPSDGRRARVEQARSAALIVNDRSKRGDGAHESHDARRFEELTD